MDKEPRIVSDRLFNSCHHIIHHTFLYPRTFNSILVLNHFTTIPFPSSMSTSLSDSTQSSNPYLTNREPPRTAQSPTLSQSRDQFLTHLVLGKDSSTALLALADAVWEMKQQYTADIESLHHTLTRSIREFQSSRREVDQLIETTSNTSRKLGRRVSTIVSSTEQLQTTIRQLSCRMDDIQIRIDQRTTEQQRELTSTISEMYSNLTYVNNQVSRLQSTTDQVVHQQTADSTSNLTTVQFIHNTITNTANQILTRMNRLEDNVQTLTTTSNLHTSYFKCVRTAFYQLDNKQEADHMQIAHCEQSINHELNSCKQQLSKHDYQLCQLLDTTSEHRAGLQYLHERVIPIEQSFSHSIIHSTSR